MKQNVSWFLFVFHFISNGPNFQQQQNGRKLFVFDGKFLLFAGFIYIVRSI